MQQPRMRAHDGFSGCVYLRHAEANARDEGRVQMQALICAHAYIFDRDRVPAKASHGWIVPVPSMKAWAREHNLCSVHARRGDCASTGASSTFQPLVERESLFFFSLPLPPCVSASYLAYELRTSCEEQTANTSVHPVTFNQVSDCLVLHCSNGPWQ